MVTLRDQTVRQQGTTKAAGRLPDIDEIEPLGPHDAACLEELRDVLVRHGAINRFGISLLHDHFALASDEMLVETCDPDARVLTTAPEQVGGETASGVMVETNWRFTDTGQALASLVCRVGCFVDLKDKHRRTHQRVNR